jgi:hypothetical protein
MENTQDAGLKARRYTECPKTHPSDSEWGTQEKKNP